MKIKNILIVTLLSMSSCYSINLNKESLKTVENRINIKFKHVKWSPDSNKIAFINTDNNKQNLYIFDYKNNNLNKVLTEISPEGSNSINWFDENNMILKGGNRTSEYSPHAIFKLAPRIINIESKKVIHTPKYSEYDDNDIIKVNNKLILVDNTLNTKLFVYTLDNNIIELTKDFEEIKTYKIATDISKIFILGKLKNQDIFKIFTIDIASDIPEVTAVIKNEKFFAL